MNPKKRFPIFGIDVNEANFFKEFYLSYCFRHWADILFEGIAGDPFIGSDGYEVRQIF